MRERVSAEQKMRMLGIVPCMTAFPAWVAGKVRGELLSPPIRPGAPIRGGGAALFGCSPLLPSRAIGSASRGLDWQARAADLPRFGPISLEHPPCSR